MSRRIVQFTALGSFGRFGNQIFQYLFARAYAEKYNATLEIPSWVGEKVFKNVSHPKPSGTLPITAIDNVPWGNVNINLMGYYQKKEFISILSEKKIRDWLQFQDKWIEKFKDLQYNIVAHLRIGDLPSQDLSIFCILSENSYLKACDKFGIDKKEIVWLKEETQQKRNDLDDDLQFLPDFFTMMNAKVLLRGNSTFSFWAGFFNKGKVYSPVVKNKIGYQNDIEFVEGNSSSVVTVNDDFIFSE
jgi:hypothetical protein